MDKAENNEIPNIENRIEGPHEKTIIHISAKEYDKEWGDGRYPYNTVYSKILENLPLGELRKAFEAATKERDARMANGSYTDPIITDEAKKYAFRGIKRRSDEKPTYEHPKATLATVDENLHTHGIDAVGLRTAKNIMPGLIWDMYAFPSPNDIESGINTGIVVVYRNEPYVLPTNPGETETYFFNSPNFGQKSKEEKISVEDAKRQDYPTLRDLYIGEVEIHFDQDKSRLDPEKPHLEKYPFVTRLNLDNIINDPRHKPEDLMQVLDVEFGNKYNQDAGVWENYSLREHTLMAMGQFRKYFYDRPMPEGINKNFVELVFALHDIGVPDAIKNGGKHLQHEYTVKIMEQTFSRLDFSPQETNLATALVDGDPIGSYLKHRNPEISSQVIKMAKKSGLPLREFWETLKIFYMCDAGSYTADAGGIESLDYLFVFDRVNHTMDFSSDTKTKIQELERQIFK